MFSIYDLDNNKIECEVLFSFENNNKNYLVYVDSNNDVLASLYKDNGDNTITIFPIIDDKDYDIVDMELAKRDLNG